MEYYHQLRMKVLGVTVFLYTQRSDVVSFAELRRYISQLKINI